MNRDQMQELCELLGEVAGKLDKTIAELSSIATDLSVSAETLSTLPDPTPNAMIVFDGETR